MSEFKEKIDSLVGQMVQGDDGNYSLPKDIAAELDEPTLFAVNAERRVRDNQSAFSKAQREATQNKAVADALEAHILENTETPLTAEQKDELAGLKKSDPEAWRQKLNEYEVQGKQTVRENLSSIRKESAGKGELAVRKEMMKAWSAKTGIELTDDMVANDIPPRMKAKLEAGEATFEEFLSDVADFLTKNKVIKGADEDTDDDTKSLGNVAGAGEPSEKANSEDFNQSYEETIF